MKKLLMVAAIAAVAISCGKNVAIEDESNYAIGFSTYSEQASKAGVNDITTMQESDKGFGVLAYYTSTDWATNSALTAPEFMYNVQVKHDPTWTYSPVKYWPAQGKVSFFAYFPYNDSGITLSAKTANNTPTITFSANNLIEYQTDILTAEATDKTTGKVDFTFGHILSKIGFSAKQADDYLDTKITIKSVKVSFAANKVKNEGVYTFGATSFVDPTTLSYHSINAYQLNAADIVLDNTTALAKSNLNDANKFMMLIPQAVEANAISLEIIYEVTTVSSGHTITNTKTVNLPAYTWDMSKQYTYNFNIKLDAIEFDVVKVIDWTDGTQPGDIDIN